MSHLRTVVWQLLRFGLVGAIAAVVHLITALMVDHYWSLGLPVANLVAFLTAFWVSLLGHQYFSFQATDLPFKQTLWRFLLVAVMGFMVNESCVIALHALTPWNNLLILVIAIFISAVITFLLSRYFAFKSI